MSQKFSEKEVSESFVSHLEHLAYYWVHETHAIPEEFSNLDGLTHSFFAAIAGVAAAQPGFLIVPIDEIQYPINETIHSKLEQDILPHTINIFFENNQEVLNKYTHLFNIKSVNYYLNPTSEKNDNEFDDSIIRNIWQHIEYWHSQPINPSDRAICFIYSVLNILNGQDVIPQTMIVPYSSPEDIEYYKNQNENYYTSQNYNILNDIGFIAGGNCLHQRMYGFNPTKEAEKAIRENYDLNEKIKNSDNTKKVKI